MEDRPAERPRLNLKPRDEAAAKQVNTALGNNLQNYLALFNISTHACSIASGMVG
jgi:hypothetical protein